VKLPKTTFFLLLIGVFLTGTVVGAGFFGAVNRKSSADITSGGATSVSGPSAAIQFRNTPDKATLSAIVHTSLERGIARAVIETSKKGGLTASDIRSKISQTVTNTIVNPAYAADKPCKPELISNILADVKSELENRSNFSECTEYYKFIGNLDYTVKLMYVLPGNECEECNVYENVTLWSFKGKIITRSWEEDDKGNCKAVDTTEDFEDSGYIVTGQDPDGNPITELGSGNTLPEGRFSGYGFAIICGGNIPFDFQLNNPNFDKTKCCGIKPTPTPIPSVDTNTL